MLSIQWEFGILNKEKVTWQMEFAHPEFTINLESFHIASF